MLNSYAKICNILNTLMINYGGYANVNIPRTIETFVIQHAVDATASNNYTWSPEFSTVTYEINRGRSCLLGFAAGSPYGHDVGHMTCCVGYIYNNGVDYTALADGWETYLVYRAWGIYNDFVFMCDITIDGEHNMNSVSQEE